MKFVSWIPAEPPQLPAAGVLLLYLPVHYTESPLIHFVTPNHILGGIEQTLAH